MGISQLHIFFRSVFLIGLLLLGSMLELLAQVPKVNAQKEVKLIDGRNENIDSLKAEIKRLTLGSEQGYRLHLRLVRALNFMRSPEAELEAERLKTEAVKRNDKAMILEASGEEIYSLFLQEQRDEAFLKIQQLETSDTVPNVGFSYGRIYTVKALIYRDWGDLGKARQAISKAQEYLIKLGDDRQLGNLMLNTATIYGVQGTLNETLDYYDKALSYYQKANDKLGVAYVYNNIADLLNGNKDYENALNFIEKAINTGADELQPVIKITFALTKSEILVNLKRSAEAFDLLSKTEVAIKEGKYDFFLPDLYTLQGQLYRNEGKVDLAIKFIRKSLILHLANNHHPQIARCYDELSSTFAKIKKYDSAYYYSIKANSMSDTIREEAAIKYNEEFNNRFRRQEAETEIAKEKILNDKLEEQLAYQARLQIMGIIIIVVIIGALVVAIVLGRRIRAQNKLLLTNARLLERTQVDLQKVNDTKDKLFRLVAHDLRGPIGGLKNLPYLLKHNQHLPAERQVSIDEIADAMGKTINTVYDLLEGLLTWAQANQGELKTDLRVQPLKPVLEKVLGIYKPIAEKKLISLECCAEGIAVEELSAYFDAESIQTIIRNIIGNAIKFTPVGGVVAVSIVSEDQNLIQLSIKDSGTGMPKEVLENLYQPNRKFTRVGTGGEKGSGIGLMLVFELAALNNIKLDVDSEEGKGTTFRLWLKKNHTS